jgi:hypothetical protein
MLQDEIGADKAMGAEIKALELLGMSLAMHTYKIILMIVWKSASISPLMRYRLYQVQLEFSLTCRF